MDTDFTHYEVLRPTNIESLYEVVGRYAYEAAIYQEKTCGYIKKLLVATGKYPPDIIVRRMG